MRVNVYELELIAANAAKGNMLGPGETLALLEEIARLDRERGQACYDRDAARSLVAHYEAEVKRLEALLEKNAE